MLSVGDRVRIMAWEDLEVLYDIDDDGDIRVAIGVYFTRGMRQFCGMEYEIAEECMLDDGFQSITFCEIVDPDHDNINSWPWYSVFVEKIEDDIEDDIPLDFLDPYITGKQDTDR